MMEGDGLSRTISKKVEEKLNTEDLICEIEKLPALWDPTCEGYANKIEKQNCWNAMMVKLIPDFEEKPLSEKKEILVVVQKKWKGIRSCYARELLKKKQEKSGSGACGRKQYVYFEALRFLETVSKHTASNMDEETNQDNEHEDSQELGQEMQTWETEKRPGKRSHNQSRNIKSTDDELIELLKKKALRENQQATNENDEDRMFLLSLVTQLHKVPADRKLKLKQDIIATIYQAQQVYQQWPQDFQHQAPPRYQPPQPSPVFHYIL
ncbi:uncharacterized protein [Macrobrachium rosenbergii]|uniref:uncharacterized protein n=1 Tax=Macrobrachium rosenbergii TaxID=79674 RepID=UPI0034D6298A